KTTRDHILGISYLSQTVLGVLGNTAMFLVYVRIFVARPQQQKPTDLILTHPSGTNTVTLLTRGVPETMAAFGMKNILDDVGCKIVLYVRRVARGLSICTTCLLSVFQAVTVGPGTSRWSRFKPGAPRYILPSFLFFWILNMLISISLIVSAPTTTNISITRHIYVSKYCSSMPRGSDVIVVVTLTATTLRDLVFVCLMAWAGGYTVIVLRRHHRRVRHVHGVSRPLRSSTETRAIHTILLLVGCYVCFCWTTSCMALYLGSAKEYDPRLQRVSDFLSACYPLLCPWGLISRDPRIHRPRSVLENQSGPSLPVAGSIHRSIKRMY
uniref:Vomeronasal type-1 receptor n=2 Tax=Ornithorhynchus anatinus TaxID=9258 RepID=F7BJ53_ORNAN